MTLYRNPNTDKPYTSSPDKYPQKHFHKKACRFCQVEFEPIGPSHLYCTIECANKARDERYLQRVYKISRSDYLELLKKQGSCCKVCGEEGFLMNPETHKRKLVVDHCHTSGKVRGLLCHNCNRALGLFKDKIEVLKSAIKYLEGATTIPEGSTLK